MCPCRVQLAPFFPSVAPGNLGKPLLHALPSRAQAGQLPTLLGRMAASGGHANGQAAIPAKQVQEVHLCISQWLRIVEGQSVLAWLARHWHVAEARKAHPGVACSIHASYLSNRDCTKARRNPLCCLHSLGLLSSEQTLTPVQGKAGLPKSPQKQPRIEGLLASAAALEARAGYSRKRPAEDSLETEKQIWPSQWLEPKQDAQTKRHALSFGHAGLGRRQFCIPASWTWTARMIHSLTSEIDRMLTLCLRTLA